MKKIILFAGMFLFLFGASAIMAKKKKKDDQQNKKIEFVSPQQTMALMQQVADWQLENGLDHPITHWTNGAMYAGILELAPLVNNPKYYDILKNYFDQVEWMTGPYKLFADDYCVAQAYCELYKVFDDARMIRSFKQDANQIISAPEPETFDESKSNRREVWNWCDALFMAPPALTRLYSVTGQKKYLDGMDRLFWQTTHYLYDKEEQLYYRDSRYFGKKEANGKKVFWGRGNGWVMGGLVRVLQDLPADYPTRPKFEKLYKDMSAKIATLITEDGTWHASLLDPESYPSPETSGTGFFTYALAWGINVGMLDEETYLPVVTKGWQALVNAVHTDGKLGYVQQIGADPQHTEYDDTEVYGAGAFLLAGSEVLKIMLKEEEQLATVIVENKTAIDRGIETIELDWSTLAAKGAKAEQVIITDFLTGQEIPSQIVNDASGNPELLIFQTKLSVGTVAYYIVKNGNPQEYTKKAGGRVVPERYNDYAWENDVVAFRVYQEKLIPVDGPSGGIDVWSKSTKGLIIDSWYEGEDYHKDHGEGCDSYKVGPTLGGGGIALVENETLNLHANYKEATIIADGPIRISASLTFGTQTLGGKEVNMTKIISLDAGSNLNKYEVTFDSDISELPIATGIVRRKSPGNVYMNEDAGILAYWEPENKTFGHTGLGIVMPNSSIMRTMDEHFVALATAKSGEPFTYYSGACWSKSTKSFRKSNTPRNNSEWIAYLKRQMEQEKYPLEVLIK